jgi:hypothetical protein
MQTYKELTIKIVKKDLRDHSLFMTGGGLAKKGGGS